MKAIGDVHVDELRELRRALFKFQMYMHRTDGKQETYDRLYGKLKEACSKLTKS